MFAVVIAALEILANISHTASEAIPLLKRKCVASGIDQIVAFQDNALHDAAVSVTAPIDPGIFDPEVVRELEEQAADPLLIDRTVGWADTNPRAS